MNASVSTFDDRGGLHMEAIRRVMLSKQVALQFDDVISQAPANRCITVFTALVNVMQNDPQLSEVLQEAGVVAGLHAEARRRLPQGPASMPPLIEISAARQRGDAHVG